jgi:pyruvate,water dikinase
LAREEFIIANDIKIHPNALINYKKLKPALRKKIDMLTLGYPDKTQFYVDKLAEGIGKIGAAFYPKQVIVRFSDFKTNEYRSLVGGELYEPKEENPMIGFRGASRYYDPKFKDAFVLECKAIKKVREEFGLDNVVVMIPFCRTIEEGKKVIEIMAANGLKKSDGLKIYVMCEIPSNVILAEKFLEIFDGFSIGSNDLTQLTLGLDRDNSELAGIGNEKNEAVKELIEEAIKVCQNNNKYIGICGQGPSDFPDFAQFLVELGIESISLNPDSVIKTKIAIAETEKKLSDKNN